MFEEVDPGDEVKLELDSVWAGFGLLLKAKMPISIPMAIKTSAAPIKANACLLLMLFICLVVDRTLLIGLDRFCLKFVCEILYLSIISKYISLRAILPTANSYGRRSLTF